MPDPFQVVRELGDRAWALLAQEIAEQVSAEVRRIAPDVPLEVFWSFGRQAQDETPAAVAPHERLYWQVRRAIRLARQAGVNAMPDREAARSVTVADILRARDLMQAEQRQQRPVVAVILGLEVGGQHVAVPPTEIHAGDEVWLHIGTRDGHTFGVRAWPPYATFVQGAIAVPDLSPNGRDLIDDGAGHTQNLAELESTLVDLAKQGRREDFDFLAGAAGVSAAKLEELWTGTRQRLGLES